jgi:hypothetical protein
MIKKNTNNNDSVSEYSINFPLTTENYQYQKGAAEEQAIAPINQNAITNAEEILAPSKTDVADMISRIKQHLQKFDIFTEKSITDVPAHYLEIPNESGSVNVINLNCLLNYLSKNPNFLGTDKDKCSQTIKNYLDNTNDLDLHKLIALGRNHNTESDFIRDTKFYSNLYGFNISLVSFIANSKAFKNADAKTQENLLSGIQNFVRQSLNYLSEYMNRYKVIDDKLLNSSYNLLYLLNILSFRKANVGKSMTDIEGLYGRVVNAITENIKIYESIDKDKLEKYITQVPEDRNAKEIADLYLVLEKRLAILMEQREKLRENVDQINLQSTNLSKFATPKVLSIANQLQSHVISSSNSKITSANNKSTTTSAENLTVVNRAPKVNTNAATFVVTDSNANNYIVPGANTNKLISANTAANITAISNANRLNAANPKVNTNAETFVVTNSNANNYIVSNANANTNKLISANTAANITAASNANKLNVANAAVISNANKLAAQINSNANITANNLATVAKNTQAQLNATASMMKNLENIANVGKNQ